MRNIFGALVFPMSCLAVPAYAETDGPWQEEDRMTGTNRF